MKDWQEFLIIILAIFAIIFGYFIYLGYQISGLQESIGTYNGMSKAFSDARGGSQTPDMSPFSIIANGLGR